MDGFGLGKSWLTRGHVVCERMFLVLRSLFTSWPESSALWYDTYMVSEWVRKVVWVHGMSFRGMGAWRYTIMWWMTTTSYSHDDWMMIEEGMERCARPRTLRDIHTRTLRDIYTRTRYATHRHARLFFSHLTLSTNIRHNVVVDVEQLRDGLIDTITVCSEYSISWFVFLRELIFIWTLFISVIFLLNSLMEISDTVND